MIDSIFNDTRALSKALDAAWLRNEVINNNISNVDTPDFKASKVEFENVLKDALEGRSVPMKVTNGKHISSNNSIGNVEASVIQDNESEMRMDGNNVDIESEEANLAKNAIYYNTLIQKIGKEYSRLRYAISEGK